MTTTLITGATGGLGNAVARLLSERMPANTIAVMARDTQAASLKALQKKGVAIRQGDYNDKASMERAFAGITTLYFVSGNDLEHRLEQHQKVIEAAKNAGVKHVFYTSSLRKSESPESPLYPVLHSHIQTEEWLKDAGLDYTILRHNLYAEVILMFAGNKAALSASKTIFFPAGEGKTAFVPREELALAAAIMLSEPTAHAGKIYQFSGGESIGYAAIAGLLTHTLNASIQYVSPDLATYHTTMSELGVPAPVSSMLQGFAQATANGEFDHTDNDLQRIIGRPVGSVSDFLSAVYA